MLATKLLATVLTQNILTTEVKAWSVGLSAVTAAVLLRCTGVLALLS
jgi:hypothetical protein